MSWRRVLGAPPASRAVKELQEGILALTNAECRVFTPISNSNHARLLPQILLPAC